MFGRLVQGLPVVIERRYFTSTSSASVLVQRSIYWSARVPIALALHRRMLTSFSHVFVPVIGNVWSPCAGPSCGYRAALFHEHLLSLRTCPTKHLLVSTRSDCARAASANVDLFLACFRSGDWKCLVALCRAFLWLSSGAISRASPQPPYLSNEASTGQHAFRLRSRCIGEC